MATLRGGLTNNELINMQPDPGEGSGGLELRHRGQSVIHFYFQSAVKNTMNHFLSSGVKTQLLFWSKLVPPLLKITKRK